MTPAKVFRTDDVHDEYAGISPLGPIPHTYEAKPKATQSVLAVGGHPLLLQGDTFRHEGASHKKPNAGNSFAKPAGVTEQGHFSAAGQALLFIDGRPVMTIAGSLTTCTDATPETGCEAAVLLIEVPPLFLSGSSVLPGHS